MKNLKSSVKNILSVAVTAVLLLNTTVSLSAEENQKDSGEISVAYNYTDENAYRSYKQKYSFVNSAVNDVIIEAGNES